MTTDADIDLGVIEHLDFAPPCSRVRRLEECGRVAEWWVTLDAHCLYGVIATRCTTCLDRDMVGGYNLRCVICGLVYRVVVGSEWILRVEPLTKANQ